MKISIEFETGNDAFENPNELDLVLERARDIIQNTSKNSMLFSAGTKLRDSNGATIGKIKISE